MRMPALAPKPRSRPEIQLAVLRHEGSDCHVVFHITYMAFSPAPIESHSVALKLTAGIRLMPIKVAFCA